MLILGIKPFKKTKCIPGNVTHSVPLGTCSFTLLKCCCPYKSNDNQVSSCKRPTMKKKPSRLCHCSCSTAVAAFPQPVQAGGQCSGSRALSSRPPPLQLLRSPVCTEGQPAGGPWNRHRNYIVSESNTSGLTMGSELGAVVPGGHRFRNMGCDKS